MSEPRDRLLLFGATGIVGAHLLSALAPRFEVTAVRFRSPEREAPVRWEQVGPDPEESAGLVARLAPRIVVNAAALARIGDCQGDPDAAERLNVALPEALADAAGEAGARLVHLSTDQVFDGAKGRYVETDEPTPYTVYGITKREGERRVLDRPGGVAVVRLNLVYGPSRGNAPSGTEEMIAAARRGDPVFLFTDEFRSPLFVGDAAAALEEVARSDFAGILHLGGPERLSRYELGSTILSRHGLGGMAVAASIEQHPGPPRAPDTSFDSRRARELLANPPAPLEDRVFEC